MRTIKQLAPALALLLVVTFLVKRYLIHPSPDRILQQTLERYKSLEFYSDSTTVSSDLTSLQGGYEFAYGRPNKLRVQFRGLLDDELVVADGTTLYVYRPSANAYRATPAPARLADELPGAQQMLKISLLNGTLHLQSLGNVEYQGRRKLGERWMHRVEVAPQSRGADERAGAGRTSGPRSPSGEMDGPGLSRMVLWIGVEDALVYRIDIALKIGSERVTHSLVSDGISTDPIPVGTFTFKPPPGARPVARFEAPQLEPDIAPRVEEETVEQES